MPYELYRILHFVGIFLLFVALGGVCLHAANGGTRASSTARGLVAATHGIGLFFILLAGFGLLARLGIAHGLAWPGWVWTKFGIWLLLGVLFLLPYRAPALARPLLFLLPLLGGVAAYLAIYKPF